MTRNRSLWLQNDILNCNGTPNSEEKKIDAKTILTWKLLVNLTKYYQENASNTFN